MNNSLRGPALKVTPQERAGSFVSRREKTIKSSLNLNSSFENRHRNVIFLKEHLKTYHFDEQIEEKARSDSGQSNDLREPDSPLSLGEPVSEDTSNDLVTTKDFGVFLPNTLKEKLIRTGMASNRLPTFESALGCVMIADISGFTKLGEQLRKQYGEGEGSARLAADIDDVLSEFILCVYAYGGDIIKFAGDAIICVFLGEDNDRVSKPQKYMEDSMLRSKLCAKALIDLVDHDRGGLRMHGGICWGEIYFLRVGSEARGPGHAMYMIAGKCVNGAGDALEETTHGQVQVHNNKEIITADTEIERSKEFEDTLNSKTLNLKDMVKKNISLPNRAVSYISTLCHQRLTNQKHSHFTMSDDIRRASIVFISLPELELDYNDTSSQRLLNSVFEKLTSIVYKYGGFCRDFLFEDKGCTFIAVFGALKRGEHDELRAVLASIDIQKALKTNFKMTSHRIGVSSGDVYCGLAGPIVRRDCIVMGSEVNMAARLMGKAVPGSILVSKKIYKLTTSSVVYSDVITVSIKGFEGGFPSYSPRSVTRQNRRSIIDVMSHKIFMVGREKELRLGVAWMSESCTETKPGLLVVEGDAGIGKSVFVESLARGTGGMAAREPWFILGSEVDQHSPLQVFSGIVSDIICDILKLDTIDDVNFSSVELDKIFHGPNDRILCSIIVPQLAPTFQLQGLGLSNKQVYEQLHNVIIHILCKKEPGLIIIDDAQWVDSRSWDLLIKIFNGMTTMAKKFQHLVVVATRPLDLESNDVGESLKGIRKFRKWFSEKQPETLEKNSFFPEKSGAEEEVPVRKARAPRATGIKGNLVHISLKDLDESSMKSIIANEIKSPKEEVDDDLYRRVMEASSGSPTNAKIYVSWALEKQLIIEPENDEGEDSAVAQTITAMELRGGSARLRRKSNKQRLSMKSTKLPIAEGKKRNKWRLQSSSIEIKFPASVNSVILSRIDHMDYELGEALKVASCVGFKFEVELLRYMMNATEAELERILDELSEKRFFEAIIADHGDVSRRMFKFREHSVFGSVKTLLMGSQRKQMHSKIFSYLQITECPDLTLLAFHAEESGNQAMAAVLWEKAFNKSISAFDFSQAQTYLDKAIVLKESEALGGTKAAIEVILLKKQLGDVYRQVARYEEAKRVLASAMALWRTHCDTDESWEVKVDILSHLGRTSKEQGNYEDALEYIGEMLEITKEKCKPDDMQLAAALTQYAEVLRKQTKVDESLEMHRQALAIYLECNQREKKMQDAKMQDAEGATSRRLSPSKYTKRRMSTSMLAHMNSEIEIQLSNCYTFIGCCLASKKMAKEAGMQHQQALWIRNKYLSGMHPMLSESLNYVGEAMLMQGQPSKSLPFLIRALAVRKIAFGPDHPAVAHVLGLLASAQRSLGRFIESRGCFLEW